MVNTGHYCFNSFSIMWCLQIQIWNNFSQFLINMIKIPNCKILCDVSPYEDHLEGPQQNGIEKKIFFFSKYDKLGNMSCKPPFWKKHNSPWHSKPKKKMHNIHNWSTCMIYHIFRWLAQTCLIKKNDIVNIIYQGLCIFIILNGLIIP